MRTTACALVMVLIVGLTAGCGLPESADAANSLVGGYLEAIRAKDFDKALTYMSPEFYEASTRPLTESEVKDVLAKLNSKLGDLQEYRLVDANVNVYLGTERPSGTYCVLTYEVTYSRESATETFTLFKPRGAGDNDLRILGHNIDSPGLLK